MFGFGYGEMLVLALICLLIFGKRLPSAMKSLGQGINVFRKTVREETQVLAHMADPVSNQH